MKILAVAAAAALTIASATGSYAVTMDTEFTGTFTSSSGTGSMGIDDTGRVARWPVPGCSGQSSLSWFETGGDGDYDRTYTNVTAGNSYVVGGITWSNASTCNTDGNFNLFATMTMDFDIPQLSPANQGVSFNVTNTTNPPGDLLTSNSLQIGNLTFGSLLPVDLGGGLFVSGFRFIADGESDNVYDPATGKWTLKEDRTASLHLVADISAVPLPAAAWMLLAGVGGLAAVARRKKTAA
jgi:hypothetical protein